MGYEKLFNPALQYNDEQKFVDYILADQPETPFYFGVMERVNKIGPELIRNLSLADVVAPIELARVAGQHLVSAPKFIAQSSLADKEGWVEVDKHTLRDTRFANVFGLGDCSNLPTSNTVAAIRKQAPVVVKIRDWRWRGASPCTSYA